MLRSSQKSFLRRFHFIIWIQIELCFAFIGGYSWITLWKLCNLTESEKLKIFQCKSRIKITKIFIKRNLWTHPIKFTFLTKESQSNTNFLSFPYVFLSGERRAFNFQLQASYIEANLHNLFKSKTRFLRNLESLHAAIFLVFVQDQKNCFSSKVFFILRFCVFLREPNFFNLLFFP